jgi:hypothetical protein
VLEVLEDRTEALIRPEHREAELALRRNSGRAETVANLVHCLSFPFVERAANVIAVVDVAGELHLDLRTLQHDVLVERVELISDVRIGVQDAKGPGADPSQRLVGSDGRLVPWGAAEDEPSQLHVEADGTLLPFLIRAIVPVNG